MNTAFSLLLFVAGAANADGLIASPEPGWSQWRGPRRDGISDETGLLPSWPKGGPELLWQRDGLGRGWSSPIVVDGRLYLTGDVGDDLVVWAFDTNGKLLWKSGPAPVFHRFGVRHDLTNSLGRRGKQPVVSLIVCLRFFVRDVQIRTHRWHHIYQGSRLSNTTGSNSWQPDN